MTKNVTGPTTFLPRICKNFLQLSLRVATVIAINNTDPIASDSMIAVTWPSHFPADCPPSDAGDLAHSVLMFVLSDPPNADDFKCAIDRNSHRGKCECLRASLSCALDRDHLLSMKHLPRFRQAVIACAELKSAHGKIKQTGPPGHYSLWLNAATLERAAELFSVSE